MKSLLSWLFLIVHQHYPSVRDCLISVRRFVRKGELKIPARLIVPIVDDVDKEDEWESITKHQLTILTPVS